MRCECGTCPACRHRVANRAYRRREALKRGVSHRRLPVDPLLALVPLRRLRVVTDGQIYKWKRDGFVNDHQADRTAMALGYHPCELWSDWFDEETG